MIILDENIDFYWVRLLREKGYSLLSIAEEHPGIPDMDVIRIVEKYNGLLITEDKRFW